MRPKGKRPLSVRKAAAIIFATPTPSAGQLQVVEKDLERGELRGTRGGGGWSHGLTTTEDVAEYLARQACPETAPDMPGHRRTSAVCLRSAPSTLRSSSAGGGPNRGALWKVYHEAMRDYFLAIIFRRRRRLASRRFRQAVLAGQIAALLFLAGAILLAARPLFSRQPAEHAAVERWIARQHGQYAVNRWHHCAQGRDGAVFLRVEYRYFTSRGNPIDTDRVFLVANGVVLRADSELPAD